LLGRADFRRRAAAEVLYQSLALAAALTLLRGRADFVSIMGSLCASYLLASAFCLGSSPRLAWAQPDRKSWSPYLSYAPLAAAWMISAVFVLAPARIMLNYYRGPAEVGLYGVYFTGTVMVSMALTGIATTVMFPASCGDAAQERMWRLLRRAAPMTLLAAPTFILTGRLFLAALADRYPVRWGWLALFAVTATLFATREIMAQVLAARDETGVRQSAATGALTAAVQVAVGLWAVPAWGAPGAAAAFAAGLAAGTIALLILTPRRQHAALA
jgi:O-antigen/teichoic acid export membrane protein